MTGKQGTHEVMRTLLAGLGEAMDWQLGAWWSLDHDKRVLRCRTVWRCDRAVTPAFEEASLKLELAHGVGLPGKVWASGEAAWSADLSAGPSSPRSDAAVLAGLHSELCVPVLTGQQFQGAIEFFSTQVREPEHAARQILTAIAGQVGACFGLLDERSALIARLERLALTDDLTDLGNRRAWRESLERELARARRHGEPLCVGILDLDDFKHYNDTHGHDAGDRLLRQIAQTWRAKLRVNDTLARYGGEEFSLLFSSQPIGAAATVVERVRAATPHGQTCSAGVAVFNGSETGDQLVTRADAALYEAKASGRDRTVIAEADRPR